MAQCKCRQCGVVSAAREWSAGKEPACPQCGHPHFSISFATARPPAAVTEVQPGQVDGHGRRRKVIRLENLSAAAGSAPSAAGFRERMRAYRAGPGKPDDEQG